MSGFLRSNSDRDHTEYSDPSTGSDGMKKDTFFGGWDQNSFQSDKCTRAQLFLLMYFLCLTAIFLLNNKLIRHWNIYSVPQPAIAIVLGAFVSSMMHFIGYKDRANEFDGNFFFWFLLPPLIFHGGYCQERGPFFKNWFVILNLANIGTVISALVFGYGLYYLGTAGLLTSLPVMECLCYGALISATDPVSTLSIFAEMNVDSALQAVLYGSSAFDDAVAIIMYRAFQKYINVEYSAGNMSGTIIIYLITCLIASLIIGTIFGASAAILIKINKLRDDPKTLICFIICFIYISYFTCSVLEISGIMSCITAAMSLRYFLEIGKIVSDSDMKTISLTLSFTAHLVETVVFFCIGMSAVTRLFAINGSEDVRFVFWSLLLAFVSRVANVYPISYVANVFNGKIDPFSCCYQIEPNTDLNPDSRISGKKRNNIEYESSRPIYVDYNTQHMIVFTSLRGPIAYAAAILYPMTSKHRDTIYFATLAIILFNVFINGPLTQKALFFFNISHGDSTTSPVSTPVLNQSEPNYDEDENTETFKPPTTPTSHRFEFDRDDSNTNTDLSRNLELGDSTKIYSKNENDEITDNIESFTNPAMPQRLDSPIIEIDNDNNYKKDFNELFVCWFSRIERDYIIPLLASKRDN